jgi:hypothetical protein
MLQQPVEYWIDHPFPTLAKKKKYHFVLARTRSKDIGWTEVTLPEYLILEQLNKPITIMQLCEWLEKQQREVISIAGKNLQTWFQSWTTRGWLRSQ